MHEWSLSLNCFSLKICLSFVFSNVEKGVSIVEKDMYAKMFWMHEWKEGLETKVLGFYSLKGVRLNGEFLLVFVFCFEPHTHTLKLESSDLVTFVFWVEKSPRTYKSWKYVHGFVLGVHGLVFGENGFTCIVLWLWMMYIPSIAYTKI